jgi:hypothetical protein
MSAGLVDQGELTALGSCELEADPADPGDVDIAVLEQGSPTRAR